MIVEKILLDGEFVPDIPEGLEYKSATYRVETDDYILTFSPEQLEAQRITPAQGRAQLSRDSKLAAVATYIEQSDNEELKIFWEYSTFWDRNTPTVKALAQAFSIELDSFWASAKAIEL